MTKLESQLQSLLAGVQKNIPATSMVDVNGQKLVQSDIVAKLQGWIQLMETKNATKASYITAVLAVKAVAGNASQFRVVLSQALVQVFGKGNPLLADFGLGTTPRKTPSTETRILAQAKGAATRKVRGTMSKVQKLAIKGPGVTSVTVPTSGPNVVVSPSPDGTGASSPGPAPNPGK
jgi:hypothetical protein